MNLLKKHWISFLGTTFLFLSFLYFLKLAFDMNWIPPVGRASLGLAIGLTCSFIGYTLYKRSKTLLSEIVAGLGVSVMFATFAYASFSDQISWSTNTLLISMISLGGLVTVVGYKINMRILVAVSLFGGLLTPLIIRANPDQDFLLFVYVLVINLVALYLSVSKRWQELRVISFFTTVVIYTSYYVLFEPESWNRPFFYASSLFLVYMVGLSWASWHAKDNFEGLNLYMGLINAIHFVFWSILIFDNFSIPYAIPTLIVGTVFVITGLTIYRFSPTSLLPATAYLFLGMVVIAIAGGDLGRLFETPGMHHVINTSIWLIMISFVYLIGIHFKNESVQFFASLGWAALTIFWYTVAWNVEWVRWFGVNYIPFINPGALVWIAITLMGLYMARTIIYKEAGKDLSEFFRVAIGVVSQIVIGGLLTIQLDNAWVAYDIRMLDLSLVLSVVWTIHALLIFLWGSWNKSTVFRILGSLVLVVVSFKVFFFDLQGQATMHKVFALMAMGGITLAISWIHRKWADDEEQLVADDNTIIHQPPISDGPIQ
jgi:uncharacterized membrane protein